MWGINMIDPFYNLLKREANRPSCLYWVKTKGKKVKRTKKGGKR